MEQDKQANEHQYVDATIVMKQEDGQYRNIAERSYAIAGIPQIGNLVKVDGNSYVIDQVEFDTEAAYAHTIILYVSDKKNPEGGVFFY